MHHRISAWARRLAMVAVAVLVGFVSGQSLDVLEPSLADNGCSQSVLLTMASSRSGAVALMASFESASPERVLVTVALRYSRALFGVEPFLKAGTPNIVQTILEMEGARMRFGAVGASFAVEIVDLMYLRNTGTEYVTFALPLEVFRSLVRAPQPIFGRIDTERVYLEFDLSAAFFEALGEGFVRACLGAGTTAAAPAPCRRPSYVQVGIVGPSDSMVCVSVAVLRVRDAPGLQANAVGRAELGVQGRLVSVEHRDVDGFRWWHVRFPDELQGWVADGDAELDYLVRVDVNAGNLGRLMPFAPLPDLALLAEAVFEAAGATPFACDEWATGLSVATACARLGEPPSGAWGAAAEAVRERIDPVLRAAGVTPLHPWQDDGGQSMVSLHTWWVDAAQVLMVLIAIGPDEGPAEILLLQQYP